MKNIDVKKILKRTFLVFWNICAVAGFLLIAGILYYLFDYPAQCLSEEHGVWDYEQNICRHDCLKWTEEEGCIPLPKIVTECMSKGDTFAECYARYNRQ